MKKIWLLLMVLVLIPTAFGIQFGNEIDVPSIASGSFKMMTQPQLDSGLFIQLKLVNSTSIPLENYHTELKIYDSRGVLIYPPKTNLADIAFSDSNGFVNYSIFLNSCNLFSGTENCFQLDQNYTVTVTGKNIYRQEFFLTKLKEVQTNWFGDSLRWAYINVGAIFIMLLASIMLIVVAILIFRGLKGK